MSNLSDLFEGIEKRIQANQRWNTATLSSRKVVAEEYKTEDFEKLVLALTERPLDFMTSFRLNSFIFERQDSRIPDHLRQQAADNLADIVKNITESPTGSDVVSIFAAWGSHRSDYYTTCLQLLRHPEESIRSMALAWAAVYLRREDYYRLLDFRLDSAFGEIAMGGPLRFDLRDKALGVLEKLAGFSSSTGDCFENSAQGEISYRSWSPFLNWWDKHQNEFRR